MTTATPNPSRPAALAAAGLLTAVVVLFLVAYAVLSRAINWPESLDHPPATALPLIADHLGDVRLGYAFYLLSSLLIAPAAMMLTRALAIGRTLSASLVAVATLTAGLRAIGILRWLTVMPELATGYRESADRAGRELLYTAVNSYGGGIGEILGVAVSGGAWLLLLAAALRADTRLPRWTAPAAAVVGLAMMLGALVDVVAVTTSLSLVLYLVVAVTVARRART